MNFMPAIPLSVIPANDGSGGIAVNVDGTLFASVHSDQHCVFIYSVDGAGELTADPVVVGTAEIRGSAHGQFDNPTFVCFVHRNGMDTLFIVDSGNDRVVEVTASGVSADPCNSRHFLPESCNIYFSNFGANGQNGKII
jgi:hypothetical protein